MPSNPSSPSVRSTTTRSPSADTTADTTVAATTQEAPEGFLGLSPAQVIASALAAATSALAASFLGVAGTIVGAVVGSIVATIGSAVYTHSLRRAHSQLRVVRLQPVTRLASSRAHVVEGPGSELAPDPEPRTEHSGPPAAERRGLRWAGLVVGVVGAVVLALGGITVVEAFMGHPVSDATSSGTTLRHAFQEPSAPAPAPAPTSDQGSTSPAPDPAATATSGVVPGASPTGSATSPAGPDAGATDSTSAPVPPTATATDPATQAPVPTGSAPATGDSATP